jgi:prepilin-type N-terminal cleavage/methylation domain-containing protein
MRRAFTLIELLIVVAIIAILAAIAVPNFLEAQTRAKVSRCMNDLRTMATGLEAYAVDQNAYPPYGRVSSAGVVQYPATQNNSDDLMCFSGSMLTTPVSYISSFPTDPFMKLDPAFPMFANYEYLNLKQHVGNFPTPFPYPWMAQLRPAWGEWRLVAAGPDRDRGADIKNNIVYDATNGTVSDGDVVRYQRSSESRINPMAP